MDKKISQASNDSPLSNSNIKDIFEYALECLSRIDKSGYYLNVNEQYAVTCGYQPDEMAGISWYETIHVEDLEKAKNAYELMLESGRSDVELRGIRKNGSTFYKRLVLVK